MRRLSTKLALGAAAPAPSAAVLMPSAALADSTIYVGTAPLCPNAQYASLPAAVLAAQPHDTIRICAGTYFVGPAAGTAATATTQGLVIDKTLQIIGAGASKVFIEPSAPLAQANATDNVRDQYGNIITVQSTVPGDTSDFDVNPTISGVTIKDNNFLVDAGIAFNNAAGTITDSTIGPFTGSVPTTAQPNVGWGVVGSNRYAVTPQGSFSRDVIVTNDLITGYGGGGVLIDGSEASKPIYFRSGVSTIGTVTGDTITGSGVAQAQQYGVQVNAGARATITGDAISGNIGTTPGTAGTAGPPATSPNPGTGVGILLTDADLSSATTTKISGNDLTGDGYGIFNGTADFPGAFAADTVSNDPATPGQKYPIEINSPSYTPTDLPTAANNTAMGTTAAPVTVNYDSPGLKAAGSAGNYYGTAGPVIGGPSTATADGISEALPAGTDSLASTTATKVTVTSSAPPVDAFPTAAFATPDGTYDTTLTGGAANEILVAASDDFGVQSVDITANGSDLGTTTVPPYEDTWTPDASLDGTTATLVATVTDEDGQQTIKTLLVTVEPPAPAASSTTTTTTTPTTTTTTPTTTTTTPTATTTTTTPPATTPPASTPMTPVIITTTTTPTTTLVVTPTTRTTLVAAGNAEVAVTVPFIKTCLATTSKLAVEYSDAAVKGSKKTKLTFVKATLTFDGKLRATARQKAESFALKLTGLKKFTYTLKVVTTYHYKVGAKTKTFLKTQTIKVPVC